MSEPPASGDESAAFWVGGLAVAVGGVVLFAFPERGHPYEDAAYLALGAAVPALACALVLGKISRTAAGRIKACLAGLFAVFAAYYFLEIPGRFEWTALAAAALVAGVPPRERGFSRKSEAAAFLAAALGFACAFRLLWWHGGWSGLLAREPFVLLLLAGFTVLGLAAFLPARTAPRAKPGVWDAAALVLFALGATRITVDPHDGAFFAGTVALLRQGAWLLWDAPSQYGFLNMALTASIPARSAWQAVYLANAPLLFLSAAAVYAGLRLTTRGRSGVLFSALLAWAATLVAPGRVWLLDGPNAAPSVGAFRFLWCYVLLGWAAALFLRRKAGRRPELKELAPGVVFWTLGCLWSFESAVYSTAAAGPLFAMAAVEFFQSRREREAALAVFLPLAALAASVASIAVYYRLRLGRGPDWLCFVEYPLVYAGGFGALPLRTGGAVAVLIWSGVLIVALAAVVLKKSPAARWLIVPAFAVFWSTASYFVGRSHDNNVLNLAPLWLSALLACFFAADEALPAVRVLRAGALPLMTGILLAAFSDPAALRRHLASLAGSRDPAGVDRLLPDGGAELQALLKRAGAGADDGLAFFWPYLLERTGGDGAPADARYWLPLAPASEFALLGAERRRVYVRRFLDREGPAAAGWTLELKEFDRPAFRDRPIVYAGVDPLVNPRASGLDEELLRGHRVDKVVESEHWRLTHYVRD